MCLLPSTSRQSHEAVVEPHQAVGNSERVCNLPRVMQLPSGRLGFKSQSIRLERGAGPRTPGCLLRPAVNDVRWPSASFEGSRVQSASKHGRSRPKQTEEAGRLPSLCWGRRELGAPDPGAGPRIQLTTVWERPSPYKDHTRLHRVDPTDLSQKCRR